MRASAAACLGAVLMACGPSSQPEATAPGDGPSLEALALSRAEQLRARVAAESDCAGSEPTILCGLADVGLGRRGSWPSGAREVLPGLSFGMRPSRGLARGILETSDVSVAVLGDGGAGVVGITPEGPGSREELTKLRRAYLKRAMPGTLWFEAETSPTLHLPPALREGIVEDVVALEPLTPGEHGWVGAGAVWFALPPEAAPARWARIEPHGEGTRVMLFLDAPTPADPAPTSAVEGADDAVLEGPDERPPDGSSAPGDEG